MPVTDSLKHLLWLSQTLDTQTAWQVYTHFGSASGAYYGDRRDYRLLPFLQARQIALLEDKSLRRAEEILADCQDRGIQIITVQDAVYPPALRDIEDPPLVLYLRGQALNLNAPFIVAMAGTRHATPYGKKLAHSFAFDLSRAGLLVVTGVVMGCDENALLGALQAGQPVGAVVAGGVDVPYYNTDARRRLYEDITTYGFLLSESPPGTRPTGQLFRARNRILTGMADCVICVEGDLSSGTVQVAHLALEQGREVFVPPANIGVPSALGTNDLIRAGYVSVLLDKEDIFDLARQRFAAVGRLPELPEAVRAQRMAVESEALSDRPPKQKAEAPETRPSPRKEEEKIGQPGKTPEKKVDSSPVSDYIDLNALRDRCSDTEFQCCSVLADGPATADEVAAGCGLPVVAVNSALTILCIKGLVTEGPDSRFTLAAH
ncbi:MAG: DNA-protecting protein DprA [Clostridiales bacterium]|nr:DNA-protecting protein DprA [Clostridiales bacterium]